MKEKKHRLVVFSTRPTYAEWCAELGLDPEDDNNRDNYSEWRSNS
jgi:hypothetical protein